MTPSGSPTLGSVMSGRLRCLTMPQPTTRSGRYCPERARAGARELSARLKHGHRPATTQPLRGVMASCRQALAIKPEQADAHSFTV